MQFHAQTHGGRKQFTEEEKDPLEDFDTTLPTPQQAGKYQRSVMKRYYSEIPDAQEAGLWLCRLLL